VKTEHRKVARGPHAPEKEADGGGAWRRVAALLAAIFQTKGDKWIPVMVGGLVFPLVLTERQNRETQLPRKKEKKY
jgi:hypothetical protein